jgi:transmembrane sensor
MPQINDLLEDLEFIRWVRRPDKDLNHYWERWIASNPDRLEDIKLAKQILLNLQFPAPSPSVETKREVLDKLLKDDPKAVSSIVPSHTKITFWDSIYQSWRVAGILVVILAISFLFHRFGHDNSHEVELQTPSWVAITKSTNYGEKLNFALPDGSLVWLNAGSSLEFPSAFVDSVRLVKLKGEGFFEVAEDPDKPFKVQSESLTITALGTSFNVNNRDLNELRVSLVTGKVVVEDSSHEEEYFLIPGQELGYKPQEKAGEVHPFNLEQVQSWRHGTLVFKKATYEYVKNELERWYGVTIHTSGSSSVSWRFSGKFENQTLENVLISLSNIEGFTYKIDEKKVNIIFD